MRDSLILKRALDLTVRSNKLLVKLIKLLVLIKAANLKNDYFIY